MSIKRTRELRDVLLLEVFPTVDDLHAAMRNRGWCEPRKCFFKVAGTRALFELDPDGAGSHHFRIDAGHVKFNYRGYRWKGDTPKKIKAVMVDLFDRMRKTKSEAARAVIEDEIVRSMSRLPFKVKAFRTTKIIPVSSERQEQINVARRSRIGNGGDERKRPYNKRAMRKRVEGFSATL